MKKEIIFILFVLLLLGSCGQRKNKSSESSVKQTQIDLSNGFSNLVDAMPLSHAASSIEIVPLESRKECMIEKIESIILTDSDIIIYHDFKHPLLRFSREGKFQNEIVSIGKGPQECISIYRVTYDDRKKEIYINLGYYSDIKVYDLEGNFKRNMPYSYEHFASYQPVLHYINGMFLFHQFLPVINPANEMWSWAILDSAFHETKIMNSPAYLGHEQELKDNCGEYMGWKNYWAEKNALNFYNDEFKIIYHGVDTIYKFNPSTLSFQPEYTLILGPRPSMGESRVRFKAQTFYKYLWINDFFDTKEYLYLAAQKENNRYFIEFNKYTGEMNTVEYKGKLEVTPIPEGQESWGCSAKIKGFQNDLCGMPAYIFPRTRGDLNDRWLISDGKQWVQAMEAYDLKDQLDPEKLKTMDVREPEQRDKLIKISEQLSEDSNPVLFIVKLK